MTEYFPRRGSLEESSFDVGCPFFVSHLSSTCLGSVASDVSGFRLNCFQHVSVLWLGAVLCLRNVWDLLVGRCLILTNPFSGAGSCWKACEGALAVGQF